MAAHSNCHPSSVEETLYFMLSMQYRFIYCFLKLFSMYIRYVLFSGRELAFTFAICHRRSVCRLSSVCLSVCLSVCDVGAPYSAG